MRHNRKAVMAERYKLYMRKNIFNGRYFVRNLQIGICVVLAIVLIVGAVIITCSGNDKQTVTASADVSVKEALFGNGEEEKTVTEKRNTEEAVADTEEIVEAGTTEKALEESVSSESAAVADNNIEDTMLSEEKTEKKSDFDNKCIANVEETLNIRKAPSTDAEFAGSMNRGAIAKIEGTEGEWTKIKSGDVEGYVLTQYILTGEEAEEFAKDYVTLRGIVLEDGVNIREEKSTDADILTVLDKDDTITVLEKPESEEQEDSRIPEEDEKKKEASETTTQAVTEENYNTDAAADITETTAEAETMEISTEPEIPTESTEEKISEVVEDEKSAETSTEQVAKEQKNVESETLKDKKEDKVSEITWLSVMLEDGKIGYVSADLVDVESLYEIAVSAKELERKAAEEAAAKKAAEEAAARQAEAARQAAVQTANSGSGNDSNSGSDSYKGATTTPVTTTESGECIGTFTITAYCGCKKCSGGKKTASGTTPTEGRTIAADTSILPFGTQVVIGGTVYTVEDCGSGVNGNHIDIFFATHSKAVAFGKKSMKVYRY